jgi:hypothetical protein
MAALGVWEHERVQIVPGASRSATNAGGRFLVVDPNVRDLDSTRAEKLRQFYRVYGFEDMDQSNRMYVTIDTVRDSLGQ